MEIKLGSFATLLTVVFITLKLCGVINWSWWWVVSPIFISIGLALFILLFATVLVGLTSVILGLIVNK
jgi:hypothetical protein